MDALCAVARLKTDLIYFLSARWSSPSGPRRLLGRSTSRRGMILAVDLPGAFPARGRVAEHLRHIMGDMAPPERNYFQGSTLLHRRGTACCEGDRKILTPRWHDPFGDSPLDVIEILVIFSMTTGGHQFRMALYFFSKKNLHKWSKNNPDECSS